MLYFLMLCFFAVISLCCCYCCSCCGSCKFECVDFVALPGAIDVAAAHTSFVDAIPAVVEIVVVVHDADLR